MVFYVLEIITSSSSLYATFTVKGKPVFSSEAPICEICSAEIGARSWLPPYVVDLETSRPLGDLISDGTNFLLSEKACKVFEDEKVSGLHYSDETVNLGTKESGVYRVAFPKNTITKLDEKKSRLVIEEVVGCNHCRVIQREKMERFRIDENTWGGEDIFLPSGLFGVIVVTERFVEIVSKHALTNFTFIHQDEYHEDWSF